MKFGIVIVDEQSSFAHRNLPETVESLKALGCAEQNILVRHAPRLFNVVMTTQFFAEYTDPKLNTPAEIKLFFLDSSAKIKHITSFYAPQFVREENSVKAVILNKILNLGNDIFIWSLSVCAFMKIYIGAKGTSAGTSL